MEKTEGFTEYYKLWDVDGRCELMFHSADSSEIVVSVKTSNGEYKPFGRKRHNFHSGCTEEENFVMGMQEYISMLLDCKLDDFIWQRMRAIKNQTYTEQAQQ